MAKEVKFTVKLNIDGRESLVTASANAKELSHNLTLAKSESDKLRGSLISFGQIQLSFLNLQKGLQSITNVLNDLTEESQSFTAAMKAANTMAGKDAAGVLNPL